MTETGPGTIPGVVSRDAPEPDTAASGPAPAPEGTDTTYRPGGSPGWPGEAVEAASVCATYLAGMVRELLTELDLANSAGLAIPPKAAEAVAILQALSRAWQANAVGQPADPADAIALGVRP